MLNQISLFAENKKGALRRITSVLAQAHINIYTMLANDSAEFGIIRLIVTDPDNALKALQDAGYQCRLDKVLAIDMSDAPGTLDGILSNLQEANVSIDYLYIVQPPDVDARSRIQDQRARNGNVSARQGIYPSRFHLTGQQKIPAAPLIRGIAGISLSDVIRGRPARG